MLSWSLEVITTSNRNYMKQN